MQLSQHTPFFANSDPDMPAVPVPAAQVLDWILQNIASALDNISERASLKENGPSGASDPDVAMADASTSSVNRTNTSRGPSYIEGISKSSLVKQASDLKGSSVKVCHCIVSLLLYNNNLLKNKLSFFIVRLSFLFSNGSFDH